MENQINNKLPAMFNTAEDFKIFLAKQYLSQIKNFFEKESQAMKFLSSVMNSVQKTPDLLKCQPASLINAFLTTAQLGLMPSEVSGEAYILPYNNKNGMVAQFQLGYQGIVTLLYRAGVKQIRAEIVREKDKFSLINGKIYHEIDIFKSNDERGKPIAAYAVANVNGEEISKAMNQKDIITFGERFSKSYFEYDYKTKKKTDKIGKFTPWNPENDPEGWMWKKTVLKQLAKMLPKNETINRAITEDNKDSIMSDRIAEAKKESEKLKMGNALLTDAKTEKTPKDKNPVEQAIIEGETESDFAKEVGDLMEKTNEL